MSDYLTEIRKRFDQVCISGLDQNLANMFNCFYGINERLRKTCRVVWEAYVKRKEKEPDKNTLIFFANPNEMNQALECFLSILLASKKASVEPLRPDEIRSRWENGGDIVLCMNLKKKYYKSIYTINNLDRAEYEKTRECKCHSIRDNDNNTKRSIIINPEIHLVYPASFSTNARPLNWNHYLCRKADAVHFQEHTKLETPIFIFDHGTTAEKVLSSIMIGGVSAWEYFSVVNVRRDGDIRSISSASDPSIFIFSDTDHASRFLEGLDSKLAKRFERVIAVFYDTDQLFPAAANDELELQIAIRPLTDVLERDSNGKFSSDRFSGLKERGIVFSDDLEYDDNSCNDVHRVVRRSLESEWRDFYDLTKSLKRFSDNDILFSVFCMARAIFNQLRQPIFDRDRCDRLAHELGETVQFFKQQFGDVDEANQAVRLSSLINKILEQDPYSYGITEKLDAIREFIKTIPETDRNEIALAGRRDSTHAVIERELLRCGVNVVARKEAKMLIHFKRQKKYHKNSDWIFPDTNMRNVWFLFEDELKELESIKKVYRHLANVGIIDRCRKNEILGFELPTRAVDTHTASPSMPGMGVVDVLTTKQILSTFDPNKEYDNDLYSSRLGAGREFTPQLYRELKFESGCRAELTRWTDVIVERENLRKLISPSDLHVGDKVWMMLYDEMSGVSAHGFDDGATLKKRWVSVLAELLKKRYEGDVDRLVDGVNNELRRQCVGLKIKGYQVKYWLRGCTLCPEGAEKLFNALGILYGDKDLCEKARELAYKMSRVNVSHQSVGKKVSESFRDAIISGRTKVVVGQKEFDVEQFFSKQIIREIFDYDDQNEDPEDDVSNKGPFNCLIK